MSTKDPNEKKVADLTDYMPDPDVEDVEAVDLNFGFEEGEDEEAVPARRPDKKAKNKGANKEDEGDEGEGDAEGDEAGDDKDSEGDEKDDADAGKKDAKEPKKPQKHMVPKERLDKVLARNRELEAELARKNVASSTTEAKGAKEEKAFDFDAAEEAYQDAILEGDKTKAKALKSQMRDAERAQLKAELAKETGTDSKRDRVNDAILRATSDIEQNFPVLDSNSKLYNKEIADEMVETYTGLVASGKDPLAALEKALKITVKMHDLVDEDAEEEDPTPKRDVKDKLAAAKKQPPKMPAPERSKKKDLDADDIDISTLTEEEFDALPEAVLRKMRGDSF